ncbi:GDSL-type esterase/lipase family protein [Dubosiella newyorkensis]|jgi:lysophospholipase L1-like esterase|uniref:GDSL-type esterase/lipase family protein n=2 Tax=Dubosiella newyorkensis TaxID=1862672 RepID=UPI002356D2D8|nr:GDSL-type esterase/lipase family protein [Dubosiella newyorkensis]MCI9040972.1 GDSL family lipase [Dubosiella newyorkensis]
MIQKKRILCYGDSNTWGFSPYDGHRQARRWTRLLNLDQTEIIEEGLNSRTAIGYDIFQPHKCGYPDFIRALQTHSPLDLVIVMLGTNDLKTCYHYPAVQIANGLRAFVREFLNPTLWESSPMPQLMIVAPILLGEQIPVLGGVAAGFNEYSFEQSKLLSSEIQNAIAPYPVHFFDASTIAFASEADGLHMDEENHQKLAFALRKAILDILPE